MTTPKKRHEMLMAVAERAAKLSSLFQKYYISTGKRNRQWRELGYLAGGYDTGETMARLGRLLMREIAHTRSVKDCCVGGNRTVAAYERAKRYTADMHEILTVAETVLKSTERYFNGEKKRLINQPSKTPIKREKQALPLQAAPKPRRAPASPADELREILKNHRNHVRSATLYERILSSGSVTPEMVSQARYSLAQSGVRV